MSVPSTEFLWCLGRWILLQEKHWERLKFKRVLLGHFLPGEEIKVTFDVQYGPHQPPHRQGLLAHTGAVLLLASAVADRQWDLQR